MGLTIHIVDGSTHFGINLLLVYVNLLITKEYNKIHTPNEKQRKLLLRIDGRLMHDANIG